MRAAQGLRSTAGRAIVAYRQGIPPAIMEDTMSDINKDAWIAFAKFEFTAVQAEALERSKQAYLAAKAAREQFENTIKRELPPGLIAVFNYRFGGSIAIIPDDGRSKATPASAKPRMTLAEHLAKMQANGHAV
jgi:hypothetical protein